MCIICDNLNATYCVVATKYTNNVDRKGDFFKKFFYHRKCLRADVFILCTVSTGLSFSFYGLKSNSANLNSSGVTMYFAIVTLKDGLM